MKEENAAILLLDDGKLFNGIAFGAIGQSIGEVCFNTGMTGYQEILTDPSYAKQIVTMTCLLYTSPSPRDQRGSRMPSSA